MQSISRGETGPGRSVGHLRRQEAPNYGMVSLNEGRGAAQVAVVVSCLPVQEAGEMLVRFLGHEDPLEGGMAAVR